MSWLFSRALVEEYSAATCSAGARSALSSSTPTPQAFLPPDKMTAFSRPSRSGMTFAPLTESLGADLLMWFLADSRVRTFPLLGLVPASKASAAASGVKWRGSFARFDRDSSLWRTAQCSLLAGSEEFSETWPRWGSMRNGECYLRPMSAIRTCVSESGLWPTPKARDWRSGGTDPRKVQTRIERRRNQGVIDLPDAAVHRLWKPGLTGLLNPSFSESLMGWPTGWSDLEPLEMARFHEWQRQHSLSFRNNNEAA